MSSKPISTVLVVVLSVGAVVGLWWMMKSDTQPDNVPANTETPVAEESRDFMTDYDTDKNGIVTYEEFVKVYKTDVMVGPNGNTISALQAFSLFDLTNDGVVDAADTKLMGDVKWVEFQLQAKKDGYHARQFRGKNVRMNNQQMKWYLDVKEAFAQQTLPWIEQSLDWKYFTDWSQVVDKNDKAYTGFYSDRDDKKANLLKADGKLRVFTKADVTVTKISDAPQDEYASRVREIQLNDPEANLALAKDCVSWGMPKTAEQLFRRVLVFDGENKEALAALKLKIVNKQYAPISE